MIQSISPQGQFVPECTVAGETRTDGAWPAMGGAIQASRDRWVFIYSTRGFLGVDEGFRGSDNDRSIIYQLRKGGPDGPVIKEGILQSYLATWDPLNDGKGLANKQHCHGGTFGVPKGALVGGKRVPHENLFVASFYASPRALGTPGNLASLEREQELFEKVFATEWVQFRLNDDESDIEIVQKPQPMRQVGYESGPAFCPFDPRCRMNTWYVPAAPYNADMSQWVRVPHFSWGIAAIRFAFNLGKGLYEWVETGPLFQTNQPNYIESASPRSYQLTETSIIAHKGSWLITARTGELYTKDVRGVAWMRTDDPFKPLPEPVFPGSPLSKSPCSAARCPDGVIRLFTNDVTVSPYRNDRDPLYGWDVDPDNGFKPTLGSCRVLFDGIAAGLPVREESWTRVDMPNLLPHAGGREQVLTCRARLRQRKPPHTRLTDEEKRRTGMYACRIQYNDDLPPTWEF